MKVSIKTAEITLKELAEAMEVTPAAVTKFIATRQVVTRTDPKDGRVTLAPVLAVIRALRAGEATEDGEAARLRKLRAEADLAEMERDQGAGKLLDAHEAEAAWTDQLAALRANLLAYPDRVLTQLEACVTPAERVAVLRAEMKASLEGLVREAEGRAQ